ncbi:MAG: hypothetical protein WCL49_01770 [bacterium]
MTSYNDLIKSSYRLLIYHRQRIWWITTRILVVTIVITAFCLAFRPRYVARTTITILPTRSEIGYASQSGNWASSPATLLGKTYEETLSSLTLAQDVARTLLERDRAEYNNGGPLGHMRRQLVGPVFGFFNKVLALLNTGRWETQDPTVALGQAIQNRTDVKNLQGSYVYEIAVTWENPKIAATMANLIAERNVALTLKSNQEEMRTTREFIEKRIVETKSELTDVDKKIRDYRVSEKLYAAVTDLDLSLQEQSQYQRELTAIQINRAQLDTKIESLKAYQTPVALVAIESERAELKTREAAIQKAIDAQMAKLDKLPAKEAGLLDLYRTRLTTERAMAALQDRLLDTKVSEAAQLSSARVIDKAIVPLYPEGPLMLKNILAALIVGLLLSGGYILMMEAWRPGLRSREDLDTESDSLLGLVPFVTPNDRDARGYGDPDLEKQGGGLPEFFRSLVFGRHGTVEHRRIAKRHLEHLLLRLTDGAGVPRSCMFVSLNGGEGKTYLIEQLVKLAKEAGRKILLIDANFGSPRLCQMFGSKPAPGLAEVLSCAAEVKDVVVSVGPGVDMIGAGLMRINSQAKWAVESTRVAVAALAPAYDLILVDTGALRSDPSATRLLPLVTDVLCVMDAKKSRRPDAVEVRQRLDGAKVKIRFILNKKMYSGDNLFEAGTSGHVASEAAAKPLARSRV